MYIKYLILDQNMKNNRNYILIYIINYEFSLKNVLNYCRFFKNIDINFNVISKPKLNLNKPYLFIPQIFLLLVNMIFIM